MAYPKDGIPSMAPSASGRQADLNFAFHIIFNHKDRLPDGSDTNYLAYEALQRLEALMVALGYDVPVRFDNKES